MLVTNLQTCQLEDSNRRTTQNPRKRYKSRQDGDGNKIDTQSSEDKDNNESTDHVKEWLADVMDKTIASCSRESVKH